MIRTTKVIPTTYHYYNIDGVDIPDWSVTTFMEIVWEEFEESLKNKWWTDKWIIFDRSEIEFKQILLNRKVIKSNLHFQEHHHNSRYELDEGYWKFKEEYDNVL